MQGYGGRKEIMREAVHRLIPLSGAWLVKIRILAIWTIWITVICSAISLLNKQPRAQTFLLKSPVPIEKISSAKSPGFSQRIVCGSGVPLYKSQKANYSDLL